MERIERKINEYELEICANSFCSAQAADRGGATRIELCQSLELGGTTPSYGLIKSVLKETQFGVYVLIRPRGGDFVFSDSEINEMIYDIELCKDMGASGVVVGALKPSGEIDKQVMNRFLKVTGNNMKMVFHRAFDRCRDPYTSMEQIIDLGCVRVLTSGLQDTAFKGRALLKRLIDKYGEEIEIMPGAGVNSGNVKDILLDSGAKSIHSSAKIELPTQMKYENPNFSEMNEDKIRSSQERIEQLVALLKKL
ncbi:MAG TPA: copper homeostasis protein CutC [Sphingobacterium sp.]|nr:copper homeostasis protein CutC [Sphingobacterium sp.]